MACSGWVSGTSGPDVPNSRHCFTMCFTLLLDFSFYDHYQFSHSVVSDSLPPANHSTPGLPVHHQPPEFTQTHFHWVSDATQPSHPLSSPSPPAFNPSQHQGLFRWVNSSHHYAKMQIWWLIGDVAGSRSIYYVVLYQSDGIHNNCFVFFFFFNIYLFLPALGLSCGMWTFHIPAP